MDIWHGVTCYLVRHAHGGQSWQQLRQHLVVLTAGNTNGSQGGISSSQGPRIKFYIIYHSRDVSSPGMFFIDLRSQDKDSILNCLECLEVDHGFVHQGGLGDVVHPQQLHQVVDHKLGVVLHRHHG